MDLASAIKSIYPDLTDSDFVGGSIVLQDDGAGPYVARWENEREQPTTDQIATALALPKPVPPPPVPSEISDRQFFQQLAIEGIITQDEALAAVQTGTIPAVLQKIVDQMADDQKFGAKMILSGATIFQFNHPMTIGIAMAYGWDEARRGAFFTAAGAL